MRKKEVHVRHAVAGKNKNPVLGCLITVNRELCIDQQPTSLFHAHDKSDVDVHLIFLAKNPMRISYKR